jgi:hypothetical protein
VEHCKHSYHAAKGDDEAPDNVRFDDKGLFVCLCRHGIPVVIVNMDTPGEQQKYVIAALKRLFAMLPPTATVILLYDIVCIVERSIQKVSHRSACGCLSDNVYLLDSIPSFQIAFPHVWDSQPQPCTCMAISGPAKLSIIPVSSLVLA